VRTLFKCKSTCLHVRAYARARARVRPFRAYACARVASNIRASSCSDAVSRWLAYIVAANIRTDDRRDGDPPARSRRDRISLPSSRFRQCRG